MYASASLGGISTQPSHLYYTTASALDFKTLITSCLTYKPNDTWVQLRGNNRHTFVLFIIHILFKSKTFVYVRADECCVIRWILYGKRLNRVVCSIIKSNLYTYEGSHMLRCVFVSKHQNELTDDSHDRRSGESSAIALFFGKLTTLHYPLLFFPIKPFVLLQSMSAVFINHIDSLLSKWFEDPHIDTAHISRSDYRSTRCSSCFCELRLLLTQRYNRCVSVRGTNLRQSSCIHNRVQSVLFNFNKKHINKFA